MSGEELPEDIFDRLMALWQEPWSELAFGEAQMLVDRLRAALAAPSTPEPSGLLDEMNDEWVSVERAIWPQGPASGTGSGAYAVLKARIIDALRAAPSTPDQGGHCRGCEADADLARRAHGPAPSTEPALVVERLAQAIANIDYAPDLPMSGVRTVSETSRRRARRYAAEYARLAESQP